MNFKPIFYVNGILLLILSSAMLLPALVDLSGKSSDWRVFAGAQIITAFFGFALIFMNQQKTFHMTPKETFVMTALSWVVIAAFAALPFCFSEIHMPYTNAFFEAMSGITATGSTVITGLDHLPHGILFWRSLLHWLGGIGFLIVALAIFPMLQISGMQLFKTQSFEVAKVMPSAVQMAAYIVMIYVFLTLACVTLLHVVAGLSMFDAVCHAMGAISTGGFSTSDASVGHFRNPLAEAFLVAFMILGSLPFALYLRVAKGDAVALMKDSQVAAFLCVIVTLAALTVLWLTATGQMTFLYAVRSAMFMIVSFVTTTGFFAADYGAWGHFVVGIALVAVFLGACSGSAGGGIKTFRLQILSLMIQQQARQLMLPNGMFQVHYNGKIIRPNVQAAVGGFVFVYLASWMIVSMLLQMFGMESLRAFTSALTALSNTAAMGSFEGTDPASVWILTAAMLLGRLEFMTLIVLLMPRFWRG
ncbi:MAG: TrkH family potassium uptake protein [Alphaproteobacteria bacterium]|nr:MAG: TrkH family potassium uptake protein [Alphaproteobacteria bacterium]